MPCMRRSSKKLPRDTNQRAAEIVRLSTEEPIQNETVTAYLSAIGRKGGLKGGKARAKKLTEERKSEIASKAANARWEPSRRKSLPQ
jgi:hypothetical protein